MKAVISSGHAQGGREELEYMTELAEKKHLKPVIDNFYTFVNITEAYRYVEKGH